MTSIDYKEQLAIKTSRGPFVLYECPICHASIEDQVTSKHTIWHMGRHDIPADEEASDGPAEG